MCPCPWLASTELVRIEALAVIKLWQGLGVSYSTEHLIVYTWPSSLKVTLLSRSAVYFMIAITKATFSPTIYWLIRLSVTPIAH
jgi:hypothetical protein